MNLKDLQQALADRQAIGVVLNLPAVVIEGRIWRDTADKHCEWEVKYLHLRGLLMRHPQQPNLVLTRSV